MRICLHREVKNTNVVIGGALKAFIRMGFLPDFNFGNNIFKETHHESSSKTFLHEPDCTGRITGGPDGGMGCNRTNTWCGV